MKKTLALLLALVLAFGLMACSSSDTEAPAGDTATDTTTDTTDTTDAADATDTTGTSDTADTGSSEFTTVTEGVLTMSTNAAFPPYEMTDDQDNVIGIDADIAAAIADKLGLELQIDDMDCDAALLAVQQGKSDIVRAGVTVNEERLAVMDFTDSYATGVQVVIVPEGSDVTLDNLGDHMIGTQRATTGNIYCTDDYGEEHVMAYDDGFTAVQALMNGQVDCVVIDNAPAQELVKNNAGLTILDTEYANEDYAIGLNKGNTALLDAINAVLDDYTEDDFISMMDEAIAIRPEV